jgi:CRISPR/Cas system-associated exonuclease Cas4 (RecB family)
MNVSIQEILDYRKCPLSYYFKYVQKLPEDNLSTQVSEQIHEIVYYFYSKVMNKDMPTIDMLKNQWESTWFSGIDPMQYILTPRNERLETGQKAVPLISNFYNANCLAPGMPLALNQEFQIELGDNIVSGKIELVREIQDGPRRVIEIVNYRTSQQYPTQWVIDYDINLSLQSYAFREKYNAKEQRLVAHYLRSDKAFQTFRSKEHYKRMKSTIDMIVKDISRGIFYPRETYICNTCDYRNYCEQWNLED